MQTVAAAIREDLSKVKDVLDIFVRRGAGQPKELAPQVELLRKIGDTLGVLGLGELRGKIQAETERLEKITQPAPNKGPRALPVPDDKPARKRGGRRARKAKEQYAMTELRKQQNRMAFGKEEQEVGYGAGDSTEGLGMIGQNIDGRVRATQIDQRTKAKLSKKNPGWGCLVLFAALVLAGYALGDRVVTAVQLEHPPPAQATPAGHSGKSEAADRARPQRLREHKSAESVR